MRERLSLLLSPFRDPWANFFRLFVATLGLESGSITFFTQPHALVTGIACWLLIIGFGFLVSGLWPTRSVGQLTNKLMTVNIVMASDVCILTAFVVLTYPALMLPWSWALVGVIIEQALFIFTYAVDLVHLYHARKPLDEQLDMLLDVHNKAKKRVQDDAQWRP